MRRHHAILVVTPTRAPQQQHGGKRNPAAHGVYHHGTGKIVEFGTEGSFQPILEAEMMVPDDTLENG